MQYSKLPKMLECWWQDEIPHTRCTLKCALDFFLTQQVGNYHEDFPHIGDLKAGFLSRQTTNDQPNEMVFIGILGQKIAPRKPVMKLSLWG